MPRSRSGKTPAMPRLLPSPVRKASWGGKDLTLTECLRVRVIDSLDEMGDDHREWIDAMLAERLYFAAQPEPRMRVMGQVNYDEYAW